MHIQLTSGDPFAFPGLWVPGKDRRPTAAIITTHANELMRPIHARVPVLLRREHELVWLDPEVTDVQVVLPLLQPSASGLMSALPVGPLVNAWANEGAALIVPV